MYLKKNCFPERKPVKNYNSGFDHPNTYVAQVTFGIY